jgi:hypothetical protein
MSSLNEVLQEVRNRKIRGFTIPGVGKCQVGTPIPAEFDFYGPERIVKEVKVLSERCVLIRYTNDMVDIMVNCAIAVLVDAPEPEPVPEPEPEPVDTSWECPVCGVKFDEKPEGDCPVCLEEQQTALQPLARAADDIADDLPANTAADAEEPSSEE